MWLFTTIGFYSVSVDPYRPERMQIRARVKGDLEALRAFAEKSNKSVAACDLVQLSEITEFPQADYRWRLFVSKNGWLRLAGRLAAAVDYSNFKNQIPYPRHNVYMDVWRVMHDLQTRQPISRGSAQLHFDTGPLPEFDGASERSWPPEPEAPVSYLDPDNNSLGAIEEGFENWDDDDPRSDPFYDPGRIYRDPTPADDN